MKKFIYRYTVSLDKETAERLEEKAKEGVTSTSQVIRWSLKRYLGLSNES